MDKYITIDEPNIQAFNKRLNELAKQGYEPIGSITKEGNWFFVIVEKKSVKIPLSYEIKSPVINGEKHL